MAPAAVRSNRAWRQWRRWPSDRTVHGNNGAGGRQIEPWMATTTVSRRRDDPHTAQRTGVCRARVWCTRRGYSRARAGFAQRRRAHTAETLIRIRTRMQHSVTVCSQHMCHHATPSLAPGRHSHSLSGPPLDPL
eukprot:417089-Prorocentrum_minimum.AAC.1